MKRDISLREHIILWRSAAWGWWGIISVAQIIVAIILWPEYLSYVAITLFFLAQYGLWAAVEKKALRNKNSEIQNDLNEDLDPYLGDGPDGEYFSYERALVRLLNDNILFANSRRYLGLEQFGGKENPETIVLFVICNDIFYWACADCESLPLSEVRTLYEMHIADPIWGSTKWCCRRRKLRPQKPVEKSMRNANVWDDELEALPKPEPS